MTLAVICSIFISPISLTLSAVNTCLHLLSESNIHQFEFPFASLSSWRQHICTQLSKPPRRPLTDMAWAWENLYDRLELWHKIYVYSKLISIIYFQKFSKWWLVMLCTNRYVLKSCAKDFKGLAKEQSNWWSCAMIILGSVGNRQCQINWLNKDTANYWKRLSGRIGSLS